MKDVTLTNKFDLVSVVGSIDSWLRTPGGTIVALVIAGLGIAFLFGQVRSRRKDEEIREEVRSYLGTNNTFPNADRPLVDRLVSRIDALEKRLGGLEHDIEVIVGHLERRHATGVDGHLGAEAIARPLTRAV